MSLKVFGLIGCAGLTLFALRDPTSAIYSTFAMPLLHTFLNPEESHKLAIWMIKNGLSPRESKTEFPLLKTELWGFPIDNPIGLAAGFDKNAEAIDGCFNFGFGLVEVGSVTPQPQAGNPLPRFFRLPKDKAVINRYGFNSLGHSFAESELLCRKQSMSTSSQGDILDNLPRSLRPGRLLGINLGKNKTSEASSHQDYVIGVEKLGPFADYLVINVSSPNTPGLRSLQRKDTIQKLLMEVKYARDKLSHGPPLLVKIAPDLTDQEVSDIASVILTSGIDGVIISNTTISRPESLKSDHNVCMETGGLSGVPLRPLSLAMVKKMYKLTNGKVPIIGCGGIQSGKDAIEFAKAGASLVQIYTSFGYEGPGIVSKIKQEAESILKGEGRSWSEIIGSSQ